MVEAGAGALRYGDEDLQQIEEKSARELAERNGDIPLDGGDGPVRSLHQRQRVAELLKAFGPTQAARASDHGGGL
jgi:hypothetical protein